jgi:hypothetical protein
VALLDGDAELNALHQAIGVIALVGIDIMLSSTLPLSERVTELFIIYISSGVYNFGCFG